MEVILLERIAKLGALGGLVKVKPGFARNFLIPQGKALPATAANMQRFEAQRAELEKASQTRHHEAVKRAEMLEGVNVTIEAQAGEEGRLFGSVGTHDIIRALANQGHKANKSEIRLPEGPIRMVGEHTIELQLQGGEIVASIKVTVVPAK